MLSCLSFLFIRFHFLFIFFFIFSVSFSFVFSFVLVYFFMLCSCFFAVFTSFSIFCRIVAALEAKLIKQNEKKMKKKENCKFSFFGKKLHHWKQK